MASQTKAIHANT